MYTLQLAPHEDYIQQHLDIVRARIKKVDQYKQQQHLAKEKQENSPQQQESKGVGNEQNNGRGARVEDPIE